MCAIFGIIFLGGITALVAWAVFRGFPDLRRRPPGFSTAGRRDPAEEILHQRFARGEMGAEELQRALRVLRG
jgi:putative membrane protein